MLHKEKAMRKSRADSKGGKWFDILRVAGNLDPGGKTPFTTQELAERAKLQTTTKIVRNKETGEDEKQIISSANQIAAAWLLKFKKWGYVEIAGQVDGSGTRPMNVWKLTEKGRNCELRESLQSRFDGLMAAALYLIDARGKKDEPKAWEALSDLVKGEQPQKNP
jgi:hypothetical protein